MIRSPILALIPLLAPAAVAGTGSSLDPPGPPQVTMLSLQDLSNQLRDLSPRPFLPDPNASPGITITQSGHYVLTHDVTMLDPDADCIVVTGDTTVIIDLNGHTISGRAGMPGTGSGVFASGDAFTVVRNGVAESFGRQGIRSATLVEDVTVRYNGEGGVGSALMCTRVTALSNTTTSDMQAAIRADIVRDCRVNNTHGPGAAIRSGSAVAGCAVTSTDGDGIVAFDASQISGCTVWDTGGDAIVTGSSTGVTDCSVFNSGSAGFNIGDNGTVRGCTSTDSGGPGFLVNTGGSVTECSAGGSASQGFLVGGGAAVQGCTSNENGGDGFNLGDGSAISGSVARRNTGNGIVVAQDCRVVGNTCDNNGLSTATAAGIEAQGGGNLIDSNMVTDNDAGIEVASDENVIIRNTAINNGVLMITNNYPISGTNQVGPIITATGTISSTNPWANFSQ